MDPLKPTPKTFSESCGRGSSSLNLRARLVRVCPVELTPRKETTHAATRIQSKFRQGGLLKSLRT